MLPVKLYIAVSFILTRISIGAPPTVEQMLNLFHFLTNEKKILMIVDRYLKSNNGNIPSGIKRYFIWSIFRDTDITVTNQRAILEMLLNNGYLPIHGTTSIIMAILERHRSTSSRYSETTNCRLDHLLSFEGNLSMLMKFSEQAAMILGDDDLIAKELNSTIITIYEKFYYAPDSVYNELAKNPTSYPRLHNKALEKRMISDLVKRGSPTQVLILSNVRPDLVNLIRELVLKR